jgi:uncharacterized membrane protein YphA (DoxX/SURF4 family)
MGIQQLVQGVISQDFLPDVIGSHLVCYAWGALFTLTGVAMLFDLKAREVALVSAGVFLVCVVAVYIPYFLFVNKPRNLLEWSAAVQESSFVGSSLIMAGSYPTVGNPSRVIRWLEKLIPYGGLFFSVMLVAYGTDHFLFMKDIATMVPDWMPGHYFWTYFAGVALISAGIAITLRIRLKWVATLVAAMFFLWLLMIHLPHAIASPGANGGLELKRVIVLFGFTGTMLLLAFSRPDAPSVNIFA